MNWNWHLTLSNSIGLHVCGAVILILYNYKTNEFLANSWLTIVKISKRLKY